jgi:hypothetical protein
LKLFGGSALGGRYPSRWDELNIICQLEEGKFPFPVVLDEFLTFMEKPRILIFYWFLEKKIKNLIWVLVLVPVPVLLG